MKIIFWLFVKSKNVALPVVSKQLFEDKVLMSENIENVLMNKINYFVFKLNGNWDYLQGGWKTFCNAR